ncbi:MAG: hypothetical protein HFI33_08210 [Lachnospiraceae bacterium]|nr:hypothetical protein [Lachnospiraceae bacterium]
MKRKWSYIGLTVLLGALLTGCEKPPEDGSRLPRYSYNELYNIGQDDDEDEDWDQEIQDLIDQYFSEEGGPSKDFDLEGGFYDGGIGDTLENVFFAMRVDEARLVESYGSYEPSEGTELVDVTITLTNTFWEELPMYNTDFQIQWGGEGDDDFRFGLSELSAESPDVMPEQFWLEEGETVEYHLIYEIPAGNRELSVSYLEEYSDGSEGSLYVIFFEPETWEI